MRLVVPFASVCSLLLSALVASAPAQQLPLAVPIGGPGQADRAPTPPSDRGPVRRLTETVSVMRESYGFQYVGGELHAEGADYWAVFDRAGIRYTPALGKAARSDRPVRLTLESIRRGETAIYRAATRGPASAAAPRLLEAEKMAIYDRGGIRERYESRRDGIEQTFVFPHRPRGAGDLVVRLRVDAGELAAEHGERLRDLALLEAGVGGVTIGAITGIDAHGRRTAGHMNFDGDHLELVLPADFVERAAYPMVLDPLIGTRVLVGSVSNNDAVPDVAYDLSSNRYLIVWQRTFSSTNIVVRGRVMDGTTGAFTGPPWISITAQGRAIEAAPAVANINVTNGFVVVWQERATSSGNWNIRARHMFASSLRLGPPVTVAGTAAHETDPDVGGESTLRNNDVSIVYKDSSLGIRYVQVDFNRITGVGIPGRRLAIDSSRATSHPAISKSGGAGRKYFIAWDRGGSFIGGRIVNFDSTYWTGGGLVSGKAPGRPDVDGDGTNFTLVYHNQESSSSSRDIWCIAPVATTRRTGPWQFRGGSKRAVTTQLRDDEIEPAAAHLGTHSVAAWGDQRGGSQYTMVGVNLDANCARCGREWETGSLTGFRNAWPSFASKRSGGAASDEALLVWHAIRLSNNVGDVMAQRYRASVGGPVRTIAAGCTGGGTLTPSGKFAFGDRFTARLSGADRGATAAVFVAAFSFNRPQIRCGSCRFLDGDVKLRVPIRSGAAAFSFVNSCLASAYNAELDMQFWVFRASARPCPIVELAGSNIIRATLRD